MPSTSIHEGTHMERRASWTGVGFGRGMFGRRSGSPPWEMGERCDPTKPSDDPHHGKWLPNLDFSPVLATHGSTDAHHIEGASFVR